MNLNHLHKYILEETGVGRTEGAGVPTRAKVVLEAQAVVESRA